MTGVSLSLCSFWQTPPSVLTTTTIRMVDVGVTLQEVLQLKIQHPPPLLGDKGKVEDGGVEGYMHTRSDLRS